MKVMARFNFSCTLIGNRPQSLAGHIVKRCAQAKQTSSMKRLFIFLTIFYFGCLNTLAQEQGYIDNIRAYYYDLKAQINKGLIDSFKFEEQADNEFHRYLLFQNYKALKLIVKSGSDGELTAFKYEYLFHNDSLIFIFTHDFRLIEHWSVNDGNPKCLVEEFRLYIKNENCIRVLFKYLEGFEEDNLFELIKNVPNKELETCDSFKIEDALIAFKKCKEMIK